MAAAAGQWAGADGQISVVRLVSAESIAARSSGSEGRLIRRERA